MGSFFSSLFSTNGQEQEFFGKEPFSRDWIIAFFLLQIVLIAWLRLYHPNRLKLLTNSYFNNRFIDQLTREEKSAGIYNWVVELLYFISFTTLIYRTNSNFSVFDFDLVGGLEFTIISLGLLLFILFKSLLMRLMAWLFDVETRFSDVHFYRFLNHSILAFVLFPILVLGTFLQSGANYWIGIAWVIVTIIYLFRLFRSAVRFWSYNSFSIKYIILYICALEILPLAFFVKASFNSLNNNGM